MSDLTQFILMFNLFFIALYFGQNYIVSAIDAIYKELKLLVGFIKKKQKQKPLIAKKIEPAQQDHSAKFLNFVYMPKNLVEKIKLHSNIDIGYSTYFTLCITCSLISALVTTLFFYSAAYPFLIKCLFSAFALICGFYIPNLIFKKHARDRVSTIDQDIPFFIDLMLICLDSGLTMEQAMEIVAKEFQAINPTLAREVEKTFNEMNLFLDQTIPFTNLMKRVPSKQLKSFVSVILYNKEQGGSIYSSLNKISVSIYEDRLAKITEKSRSLPGMLSAILMMTALPTLFMILIGPHIEKLSNFGG